MVTMDIHLDMTDGKPTALIDLNHGNPALVRRPTSWLDIDQYIGEYSIDEANIRWHEEVYGWLENEWGERPLSV